MQFEQKRKRFQVAAIYFDLITAVQYGQIGFGKNLKIEKFKSDQKMYRFLCTALKLVSKNLNRFKRQIVTENLEKSIGNKL